MEWRTTAVPEFPDAKGKPTVVYAKPLTMRDLRLVDRFGQKRNSVTSRLVKLAQLAFHDADGRQIIDINEIDEFEANVEAEVLNRVFGELGLFDDDELKAFEDAEKNSRKTGDSD
jgi:hypothetical protein